MSEGGREEGEVGVGKGMFKRNGGKEGRRGWGELGGR